MVTPTLMTEDNKIIENHINSEIEELVNKFKNGELDPHNLRHLELWNIPGIYAYTAGMFSLAKKVYSSAIEVIEELEKQRNERYQKDVLYANLAVC